MKNSQRKLLGEPAAYRPFKAEAEEWRDHGCHNNEEWHRYLKELFERDLNSDIVDGCYVGVLPETRKTLKDSKNSR